MYSVNYLSSAKTTTVLALQIARAFGLETNIGLMGIQIQYGGDADDC